MAQSDVAPQRQHERIRAGGRSSEASDASSPTLSSACQCATEPIPVTLSSIQLHALLDILTHHQTYAEVASFQEPGRIRAYGYPFTTTTTTPEARPGPDSRSPSYATHSATPLLAGLLRTIVLPVPGVRDLPPVFWHVRFQTVLDKLAEAELSDSYDKGALGTRKVLATAASAVHEALSRGILGGVPRGPSKNLDAPYDRSSAADILRAWDDGVHELVYGDLVDQLFDCAAEKQSLQEHSPAVRAATDYIIIQCAWSHHLSASARVC